MTDPLPDTLTLGPVLSWFIGTVTAWDTTNKRLTVNWRGGTVQNVAYLKSYAAPAVNDVVHGVVWNPNGMLVWGVEELRAAVAPPTPPAPTTTASSAQATYATIIAPPASPVIEWQPGVMKQSPTDRGAFFYPAGSFSGLSGVVLARFEIQLTIAAGSEALGFVLHSNADTSAPFAPMSSVYLHNVPVGVSTWVALPLGWVAALVDGSALGVGLSSDIYTATVSAGGTLRFTPL